MIQKVSKKIKFLVAVIGSLLMTSVSAFGMYGVDGDDWINFLVHGNQLRARMNQLGFTLGNGTIKGTFGVYADQGWMGSILSPSTTENNKVDFNPTLSAGIGYTSDMFGIGVGYNFNYVDKYLQVHTPTLVFNALNNNLRIAAPIQVAVTDKVNGVAGSKFTGVGFNQIELRYYTGIDAFNLIRLYASYKNGTWENGTTKNAIETLGLQLRLYFLNTQVGNVAVNPYIRIEYHQALKGNYATLDQFGRNYTLENMYNNYNNGANAIDLNTQKQSDIYDVSPFYVAVKPILSLAASSDIVSLYFEPGLGYAVTSQKRKEAGSVQETQHYLTWQAYAEMYVTPVEDLEWYFEMDVNGNVNGQQGTSANANLSPVLFETTTGITWYLPSLN
ncbi:cell surface protein [Brachyspira sp. SAP_772]|uniref:cell surface protein n=1 Tax=Brachyspira sp. SAP_772 TaxID=2608385 RepID=UPI0012F52705|nr:cell surface protein [Brachyspira sp. SAP_772]